MTILAFLLAMVVLALFPFTPRSAPSMRVGWHNRILNAFLVGMICASPIIGLWVGDYLGLQVSILVAGLLSWIGIGIALPLTLVAARLLGPAHYAEFWEYLEATSQMSRQRQIILWAAITGALFVGFIVALNTGSLKHLG